MPFELRLTHTQHFLAVLFIIIFFCLTLLIWKRSIHFHYFIKTDDDDETKWFLPLLCVYFFHNFRSCYSYFAFCLLIKISVKTSLISYSLLLVGSILRQRQPFSFPFNSRCISTQAIDNNSELLLYPLCARHLSHPLFNWYSQWTHKAVDRFNANHPRGWL